MTKVVSLLVALAAGACATGGAAGGPASGSPKLASDASLPTVDRQKQRWQADGHDALEVGVVVCVAPDGSVDPDRLKVERPSGVPDFDRAIVNDVVGWHYQPFAAPSQVRVCRHIKLAYHSQPGAV